MKALVYTGVEELSYREEKNPVEKPDESILEVQASGICGSDMHAYHGKDERRIPPLILGHEVSGTIEKGSQKGKKVVLNPLITCGGCDVVKPSNEAHYPRPGTTPHHRRCLVPSKPSGHHRRPPHR